MSKLKKKILFVKVKPAIAWGIQSLRPFVMYMEYRGRSLRTTAMVFLRSGFSKSAIDIDSVNATKRRVVCAVFISVIYSLIPGVTRVSRGHNKSEFFPSDFYLDTIGALCINLFLVFFLSLAMQMQMYSGLDNYYQWLQICVLHSVFLCLFCLFVFFLCFVLWFANIKKQIRKNVL